MKKTSDVWQIASQMQWEQVGEGVKRQIMGYDPNLMLVKVDFQAGSVGTLHAHPHSQATYVVSGKFELTIGDEKRVIEAGDGYYVAPDVLHGCTCIEPGILIDTFSPAREDFLK